MGSINSKNAMCCAAVKPNRPRTKRYPPAPSRSSSFVDSPGPSQLPDQGVNSVVLTQRDFEGTNLKELYRSQPDIEHVQIGVYNGEQWILVDEDLEKLKALRHLTSVDLSGCQYITRRGLAYFSLNPGRIKTLILNDCPKITDKFFDHIVHFSHLERLAVRGCYWISDIGVEALTVLKRLRHLDISVCATDEMTTETLSKRPTITDASMHTLARMNQLETLEMEGCLSVSDTGLVRLVTLRNLTSLNLSATGLTDWGLKILKHFPHLQTLQVAACYLSECQALEQLTAAHKLTHLDVSRVPGVTDRLIKGLAQHLDLTYLDISGCEHLSDNCMDDINTLSSLTNLNANACPGISGKMIARLSSLSKLSSLHINEAIDINYDHLLPLVALEQLEIGARTAEDEQLSKLSGLKHLTDLTLHLPTPGVSRCMNMLGINVHILKQSPNEYHQA